MIDADMTLWDNGHTMKTNNPPPISARLRETIRRAVESGETNYLSLERETGVTRASIMRFVAGRRFLRLDLADKLAARFNLELRPKRKGG
jgi:plasmid maintenance system antidote protein VapI